MKHVDLQKQYKGIGRFEINSVQPTWAKNTATTIYEGYIYIE